MGVPTPSHSPFLIPRSRYAPFLQKSFSQSFRFALDEAYLSFFYIILAICKYPDRFGDRVSHLFVESQVTDVLHEIISLKVTAVSRSYFFLC